MNLQRKTITVRIGIIIFGIFILSAILFFSIQDAIKRISFNWVDADSLNNKCGPIALKMIFDHYSIPSTLREIETKIRLSNKGASMLALKEMAELKGLHAEGWRLTSEDFLGAPFPVILFVNGDHYVVADCVLSDRLYLRDPTLGKIVLSIKDLPQIWKGETVIFKYRDYKEKKRL